MTEFGFLTWPRPLPRLPPDCCSLTSHSRSPPPPGQTLGVMTSGDDDLMEAFKRCWWWPWRTSLEEEDDDQWTSSKDSDGGLQKMMTLIEVFKWCWLEALKNDLHLRIYSLELFYAWILFVVICVSQDLLFRRAFPYIPLAQPLVLILFPGTKFVESLNVKWVENCW